MVCYLHIQARIIALQFWAVFLGWAAFAYAGNAAAEWAELTPHAGGGKGAVQLASNEILATRTEWKHAATEIVCSVSPDGGSTWTNRAIIVSAERGADLGDGHLLLLANGDLLYSYRHNVHKSADVQHYAICVRISHDKGTTWQAHSTVAESERNRSLEPESLRGLWSSFLLETKSGAVQCYYDDEDSPHRAGATRHQWISMKTWSSSAQHWTNIVTVSRTMNSSELCRDGMPSVVQFPSGRLLAVFEGVQLQPPHANCIRSAASDDNGRTWSWQRGERPLVFKPQRNHLAVSPWLAQCNKRLLCVFATDEDRNVPGISGTHPSELRLDIKEIVSTDEGRTWSAPARTVYEKTHRSYAPSVLELKDGSLLVTFMDYLTGEHTACRGIVVKR